MFVSSEAFPGCTWSMMYESAVELDEVYQQIGMVRKNSTCSSTTLE
jgi:hypothetical protein